MDFTFDESQLAVAATAERIFRGQVTVDRLKEIEATQDRFDRLLWAELAKANLLGICLPEAVGGSGLAMTELCLLLEQQGRRVAPVPLLWTSVAAIALAERGAEAHEGLLGAVIAGEAVLTVAMAEAGVGDPFSPGLEASPSGDGWRLSGIKESVPAAHLAQRIVAPARVVGNGDLLVVLIDPSLPGISSQRAAATNHEVLTHLIFDDVLVDASAVLASPSEGRACTRRLYERLLVGLAAIQLGVAEEALAQAATYTSGRIQFGKPLSSFQSTAAKAADAYIDLEAMRVTLWQAAWRLDLGLDASTEVEVAKWWASEGGQRVVHTTQHLHGGMGADVEYPIHRHFLWGKQIEDTLGGGSAHLARIGASLAQARP